MSSLRKYTPAYWGHILGARSLRLWVEFIAIFIVAPIGLAFNLEPKYMFPALWAWTFAGLILLHFTNGFRWRQLLDWPAEKGWLRVAFMAVMVLSISLGFVLYLMPERIFDLPLNRPKIWVMIMLLYPLFSALPQELMFRALYFERYKEILPARGLIAVNAALFSFAHLLYGHPVVFLMTFVGGLLFARAYLRGEFVLATLLHSVAGNMIFTSGLGYLFYSGNIH